ncbi:helix-turn-helix domain-containing protein [Lacticaseibacillus jixiensis]|uniref:helix-turn-helix domain-containing protein n=1 Tax=Lacticaseibacillus jixiensis TaxID=3231926 RepID=UPI0036F3D29B
MVTPAFSGAADFGCFFPCRGSVGQIFVYRGFIGKSMTYVKKQIKKIENPSKSVKEGNSVINVQLKEVARQQGHTLTDIAKATGISMNTLSVLGRGDSNGIQFGTLEKICNFLQITPNDLFGFEPDLYKISIGEQQNSDHSYSAAAFSSDDLAALNRKLSGIDLAQTDKPLAVYVQQPAFNGAGAMLVVGAPLNDTSGVYQWLESLSQRQQINIIQEAFTILRLNPYKDANSHVVALFIMADHSARAYDFLVSEDHKLSLA